LPAGAATRRGRTAAATQDMDISGNKRRQHASF